MMPPWLTSLELLINNYSLTESSVTRSGVAELFTILVLAELWSIVEIFFNKIGSKWSLRFRKRRTNHKPVLEKGAL
jgi:hypothetical protein